MDAHKESEGCSRLAARLGESDGFAELKRQLTNEKLEIVSSFKYLFKNGNWHRTQKVITEHASKAMHRLFSVFSQYEFSVKEKCKLFDILVSPILNYSSEVWGLN